MAKIHKDIIRQVIKTISMDKRESICPIIYSFTDADEFPYLAGEEITQWISDSLGEFSYLPTWLAYHHYIPSDYQNQNYIFKIQATRIAWLKWMLKNHTIFNDYLTKRNKHYSSY